MRDDGAARHFLFDQLLAEHGFAVLHVDNRGMAGRGRDFEQVATTTSARPSSPIRWPPSIRSSAIIPSSIRTASAGGAGAGAAALPSSRSPTATASSPASPVAPVTDWRDYDSIYTERYLGLPSEDARELPADSDVNSAADLKGHILILHGTGDDNVHIENTRQYIQKLIEAGIPYDYNIYPRKTHSVSGVDDQTELYSKVLSHFELYLKSKPAAAPPAAAPAKP